MSFIELGERRFHYEVIGDSGPWIALSPGSRRNFQELVNLSRDLAERGFRVLLHDRANCGRTSVWFAQTQNEHDLWADDLKLLADKLGTGPLVVGGSSSGARMAVAFALKYPETVRAVLLWRLTGGAVAAKRLVKKYFTDLATLAREEGMAAVARAEDFAEAIAAEPANRTYIETFDRDAFLAIMDRWSASLAKDADAPMLGASEAQLRSLDLPVCLVAGNDVVHAPASARAVSKILPRCDLHEGVVPQRPDDDLLDSWDEAEWVAAEPQMARIFAEFIEEIQGP
ncbi:hypothetical protein LNKW23_47350 [Paralimibaculum aggregatum]|uniref:AB hydrolase-1 domain-containing protein n=1 Tax=Paralimibaculum aggregatum TaxID=3036245 RepID=A0ABQ6LTW6_9RHOB|nr:alpha/beta hydrolase [Limibaculum sp. NKW23]GMG85513.1 hypothetical protein LNKW23_47350 [Limibaculum sp. NKW23]